MRWIVYRSAKAIRHARAQSGRTLQYIRLITFPPSSSLREYMLRRLGNGLGRIDLALPDANGARRTIPFSARKNVGVPFSETAPSVSFQGRQDVGQDNVTLGGAASLQSTSAATIPENRTYTLIMAGSGVAARWRQTEPRWLSCRSRTASFDPPQAS